MKIRRFPRSLLLMTTLAVAAAGARPASGQTAVTAAEAEADQRFRRGLELYREGDFAQALIELKRAYSLAPKYQALYNIGLVQFEVGDYAEALRTFEKYLADGGADVPEDKKVRVKADIEKLRLRTGRIQLVSKTVGAEIAVDDVPAGSTPLADAMLVTAGRRRVTLSQGGRVVSRVVEVAGGEVVKLEIDLEASAASTVTALPTVTAPPTVTASPPPPSSSLVWLPWAATGLLAVGTGITGGLALTAAGDLQKQRETLGTTPQEREDAAVGVRTLALVTDILGAATIVGLGVSIGVTVAKSGGAPSKTAVTWIAPLGGPPDPERNVSLRLGAGPGGVRLSGTF
jgi:hypothetical protein